MHRVALHGVGGDGNRRDFHVGAAQSATLGDVPRRRGAASLPRVRAGRPRWLRAVRSPVIRQRMLLMTRRASPSVVGLRVSSPSPDCVFCSSVSYTDSAPPGPRLSLQQAGENVAGPSRPRGATSSAAVAQYSRSWTLCPTYRKPFDMFAQGSETGDWLLGLDSNQQPSG